MNQIKKDYFLLALLLVTGYWSFKIFAPFLVVLLMAFIFWQIFRKPFDFLSKKIGNPPLASFLTCALATLLFILPLLIFSGIAAKEAIDLYQRTSESPNSLLLTEKKIESWLTKNAKFIGISEEEVQNRFSNIDVGEVTKKVAGVSAQILGKVYEEVSWFIFLVFVLLFVLYYLFLEGDKFLKYLFRLSPLSQEDEDVIYENFLSMSRATLKGNLAIGIVQGFLGGVTLWLIGVGSPVFWGFVMAVFSVLPLVGPVTVWLPMAIFLIVTGDVLQALVLIFVGAFVIGSVDNLLRPKLLEKETSLHPVLVLIGTFGGIMEFGALGFVVGPILVTVFVTLLNIFEKSLLNDGRK